jgi:hypothetical protein
LNYEEDVHVVGTSASGRFVRSVLTVAVIVVDLTEGNHFARRGTSERFAGLDVNVCFGGRHSRHVHRQVFCNCPGKGQDKGQSSVQNRQGQKGER